MMATARMIGRHQLGQRGLGSGDEAARDRRLRRRAALGRHGGAHGIEADLIAPRRQLGQHLGHRLEPEQLGR